MIHAILQFIANVVMLLLFLSLIATAVFFVILIFKHNDFPDIYDDIYGGKNKENKKKDDDLYF